MYFINIVFLEYLQYKNMKENKNDTLVMLIYYNNYTWNKC